MKASLQKLYEKFAMVRRNPDRLGVMVAIDGGGKHRVVLCLMNPDGETGTPLASFLTASETRRDELEPVFNSQLNREFQDALAAESRTTPADFAPDITMTPFAEGLVSRHL